MNNKGYTLVEVIATIAILGIISGIAIIAVTKHTADSKKQAYEAMENSIYSAANNYIIENPEKQDELENGNLEITVNELIGSNYLEDLSDPNNSNGNCNDESYVIVSKIKSDSSDIDEYKYEVHLKCSKYTNKKDFPEEK